MTTQENQVIELRKDTNKELFGYFCVYLNPTDLTNNSYIEQWSFVNKEDINLFEGIRLSAEIIHIKSDAPACKAEWIEFLKNKENETGAAFNSFMHRQSILHDYSQNGFNKWMKNNIYKIASIELNDQLDWLILQDAPVPFGIYKLFNQLSILQTLNAEEQQNSAEGFETVLTFTKAKIIESDSLNSFANFYKNDALMKLYKLNLEAINFNHIVFSKVYNCTIPPSDETVPADSPISFTKDFLLV